MSRPMTWRLFRRSDGRQLVVTTVAHWLPRYVFTRQPNGWDLQLGYWYIMYDGPSGSSS